METIPIKLPLYENARDALELLHQIDEVITKLDEAAAAQEYARRAKDTELLDRVTEYRLYAERRAGEILISMKKNNERTSGHGAINTSKEQKKARQNSEKTEGNENPPINPKIDILPPEKTKTLSDMNITPSQSKSWQKTAKIPKDLFGPHVETVKQKERERVTKETAKQQAETEKQIKQKFREERRAEKERAKQEKDEYNRRVDESDEFSPDLKALLKNKKLAPHINSFTMEYIETLKKDRERLKEIMFNSEYLGSNERRLLSKILYDLGDHFLEAAKLLLNKENIVNEKNLTLIQ